MFPDWLHNRLAHRLQARQQSGQLRILASVPAHLADYCSNDFLGLAQTGAALAERGNVANGGTGSRLISGNHADVVDLEAYCARLFEAEGTLFFQSGYTANLAVLGTLPRQGDIIYLDAQCHASLREGAKVSGAQVVEFAHNNVEALVALLSASPKQNRFVVIESLYSMSGSRAPLAALAAICQKHGACLIADEAHAVGLYGPKGQGLAFEEGVQAQIPIRIYPCGKAIGAQGGIVAADALTLQYLVNYAKPFIYTTAPLPYQCRLVQNNLHAIATVGELQSQFWQIAARAAELLGNAQNLMATNHNGLEAGPIFNLKPLPGQLLSDLVNRLETAGCWVKPIRFPTVPRWEECIRLTVHNHNTLKELERLLP